MNESECAAIVDAIARQWDGCMAPMFDPAGNQTGAIDIGATIRADGVPSGIAATASSPLSEEEIVEHCGQIDLSDPDWVTQVARAVEFAHGISPAKFR